MNNNSKPIIYRERWLTPLLQDAIKDHPVIVLTGARQVGKSTLLFNAEPFRNWRFHTLDDFDVLGNGFGGVGCIGFGGAFCKIARWSIEG